MFSRTSASAAGITELFSTVEGKVLVLGGGLLLLALLVLVLYRYATTVTDTNTFVHNNNDKPANSWLDVLKLCVPVALVVSALGIACVYALSYSSQYIMLEKIDLLRSFKSIEIGGTKIRYIEGMSVGEINGLNNSIQNAGSTTMNYIYLNDHKEDLAMIVTKDNAKDLRAERCKLSEERMSQLLPFRFWALIIVNEEFITKYAQNSGNYFSDPKYDSIRVYGKFIRELVYSRNLLHKDGEDLTNKLDDACDSTYKTHSLKIGQNWAPEDTEKLKAWLANMNTVIYRFDAELKQYMKEAVVVYPALKEFDNTDALKCFEEEKNVVRIGNINMSLNYKCKIDEYDVNIITDEYRKQDMFIVKDEKDKWVLAKVGLFPDKHLEVILSRMIYYTLLRAKDEAAQRALPKIAKKKTIKGVDYDEGSTIMAASLMNLHKELIVVNEDWTISEERMSSDQDELARLRVIKFSDVLHNIGKLYDGVRSIREMVGEFQVIAKT